MATNPAGMSSVSPGGMIQLVATVSSTGHPDATVNWAVNGVANDTFANLTFDEGPPDPACTPSDAGSPCQPTIFVVNSSSILFEQVTVLHSKQMGISFAGTNGITIQDSVIEDAAYNGIWTDRGSGVPGSTNISITNNLIQDCQQNGIHVSYAHNTKINGNTLKHNHRVALFDVCGGLCPGGQIDMLDDTSLVIYSNQIIDGQIDLNNATGQTCGIEIANQNTDVTRSRITSSPTTSA